MATATKKPHLSPTQLDMFARCGEQYRRRYIEGETIPPGIALAVGSGYHAGAATNFKQKIESHEDLPEAEIVEAAVAGFEAEVAGGLSFTEEESSRGGSIVIGDAKDSVAVLAELHAAEQAPDYQPVMVERGVRISLPRATHDILGYLDLVDDKRRVVDFKSANKKKPQSEADSSTQLTYYAAAYQSLTGEPASEVRLDTAVKKAKPERQVLVSARTSADFQVLSNRIDAMLQSIHAGIFSPAPTGAWWCSQRFCGYAATCPFYNAERNSQ